MRIQILLLGLLTLTACRSATVAPPAEVVPPGYTLVVLRTGPEYGKLSDEQNQRAFRGHFANMRRLAQDGQLLLAGPLASFRGARDAHGLFLFDTSERAVAKGWASTDPTTRAGVFELEYFELRTDAPLRALLASELERLAALTAAGETPAPGANARSYVLLDASDASLAQRELAVLHDREGGVLLLGETADGHALAVLDASNGDQARERFGPWLDALGEHTLDDWYASDLVTTLVD